MTSTVVNVINKDYTHWQSVDWQKTNRVVKNLRRRIFKATREKRWKTLRNLQRLLMKSYSNILLAVRRCTQINQGKKTPGVDGLVVLNPTGRGILTDSLKQFIPWKPLPAKRIYIPKSKGKKRPLSIPSLIDRCLQAVVKNALEPCWEAQFEGSSYGFRPSRSTHDAIEKIFCGIRPNGRKKWIVDADIQGCFDNINHSFVLKQIGHFPARKLIKQWLQAGYVDNDVFHATETGTMQGGIISPLLANITLHGMEDALGIKYDKRGQIIGNCIVVRYADDFVCLCETEDDAQLAVEQLKPWLSQRGLQLSEEKTQIVHITQGFDFLGHNIRHYRDKSSKTGYKLLTKPSQKAIKEIRHKIRQTWLKYKSNQVKELIAKLNPIIRGWANYHRKGVARKTFESLDQWMHTRARRYAKRKHPNKNETWRKQKYFGRFNLDRKDKWVFGDHDSGIHLLKFTWFDIERHVLIPGKSSPDDPNPEIQKWFKSKRKRKSKDYKKSWQKIARNQNYVCPTCRESLFNGEELHVHHIIPKSKGGKDTYKNLQLVHLMCHQQIHYGKPA
ncbi:group II intron reverse transcriptase/maturase [Plectonema cf. radiosum LEGE 06105]|uniref:Group II intron reverse transcriptase/maturase n=1 Tax=Plectonema cf. radiosum LEGE 06105 TaxID=945769 RepID=A0A8J7FQJ1_9CYAN|nr:group II intron reverse transcriptase/maturase [Plectonema radiosum]MBE9217181.1 group II intron reverse transcriptase/maturase [Plectonema cf. radiosum LEGE 06105]